MTDLAKTFFDNFVRLFGLSPYLEHYPWVKYGWYLAAALVVTLSIPTYYALHLDPRRLEIRNALLVQKRISTLTDTSAIDRPFEVQFIEGSKALLQRQAPAPNDFPGTVFEKKLFDGPKETNLRVLVLHNNAAWKLSLDDDELEIIGGGTISLQQLLASRQFRDAIGSSRHLVGVGLASTANEENLERNKRLSVDRARKLSDLLAQATDRSSHKIWRMALGGASELASNTEAQQRQRLAVVIGIDADLAFDPEKALKQIVVHTEISGIDLKAYSMSADPYFEARPIL